MYATARRATEIDLAEEIVQLGATLNELEAAVRDAQESRRRVVRLLAILGQRPGPDFVAA